MATKIAMAWFARESYDAAVAVMEDKFQPTFDEWEKAVNERMAKRGVSLDAVQKVIIDPQDFVAFCRAAGLKRDSNGRSAYAAAIVDRKNHGTH